MEKPTLILLPALMCNNKLFIKQVDKLKIFCNVIIPVVKNCSNITEATASILDKAPEHFYLAGISFGGYLALEIACKAPNRVKKLCLMATKVDPDTDAQKQNRLNGIKNAISTNQVVVTESYLSSMLYNSSKENYILLQDMNKDLGINTYINQQNVILSKNYTIGALKKFNNPCLVIAGINDNITPLFMLENVAKEIKNSVLVSLKNCGHLIPLDQPEALTALLEYFVKL